MSEDQGNKSGVAWAGKLLGGELAAGIVFATALLAVALVTSVALVVTFLNAKADRIWPAPPPAPAPYVDDLRCPYAPGC